MYIDAEELQHRASSVALLLVISFVELPRRHSHKEVELDERQRREHTKDKRLNPVHNSLVKRESRMAMVYKAISPASRAVREKKMPALAM
jgi:hypothetical protein